VVRGAFRSDLASPVGRGLPGDPGTAMAWHRKLAASKYTTTPTRAGRSRTAA
jgi:hypothetical protein